MQARAPISTFSLFSCFSVFFTRRFGLRRRGPNTHSSQNSSICGVLDVLVLIKWLGSGKYTKSTIFTAPIFQNDAPACIITPSGSSRGALLALFGTLSRATQPEYVGIYRSAFVFRSSRLHNNTFWTRRFPLFRARGLFGASWGTFGELPGELLGTLGELLGSSGELWAALGSSGQLWAALGSSCGAL
jgi:hypothetical protein